MLEWNSTELCTVVLLWAKASIETKEKCIKNRWGVVWHSYRLWEEMLNKDLERVDTWMSFHLMRDHK